MPAVKFIKRLDLEGKPSFRDENYLELREAPDDRHFNPLIHSNIRLSEYRCELL